MRIDNPSISGSLSFIGGTNSISATSVSLTGSLTGTFEGAFSGDSLTNISGAFDSVSQSLAQDITANASSINSLNAASSSYLLNTTDTLDGDLTVTGKITAQEFHTEFVSASIVYESGSTQFGNSSDDTHVFSGSLDITGNITTGLGQVEYIGTDIMRLNASNATGDIALRTAGSDRLFVSSSGFIGLGTNTPTQKLEIKGNARIDNSTAGDSLIFFGDNPDWYLAYQQSTSHSYWRVGGNHYIEAASGYKAVFDSNGNLGIGQLNPIFKLDVTGEVRSTNQITVDSAAAFTLRGAGSDTYTVSTIYADSSIASWEAPLTSNSSGASPVPFVLSWRGGFASKGGLRLAGSTALYTNDTGLGIGEDTPGHKLDIKGSDAYLVNINNTATDARLQFERNGTAYGHMSAGADLFTMYGNPGTSLRFMPGGSTAMYIQAADGNVGIGTTSPAEKLHINDAVRINNYISADSNFISYNQKAYYTDNWRKTSTGRARQLQIGEDYSGALEYRISNVAGGTAGDVISWSPLFLIRDNGQISIGDTQASERLNISAGNIKLFSGQNVADQYRYIGTEYSNGNGNNKAEIRFAIDGADTRTRMQFHTANGVGNIDERMRITYLGNVGIGTQTVNQKFQVWGEDVGLGSSAMRLYINRTGTNVGSLIFTTGGPATANGWAEIGQTDADGDLYFKANPTAANYSTRMLIQGSSGNVGIGTTSPAAGLHLYRAFSSAEAFTISNTSSGGVTQIGFQQNDADGLHHRAYIKAAKDSNGNIGGKLTFAMRAVGGGVFDAMTIRSNGDIGIGTDGPSKRLTVRYDQNGSPTIIKVENKDGNSNAGAFIGFSTGYDGHAAIGARREGAENDSSLVFSPMLNEVATERMTIDSLGRVLKPDTPAFLATKFTSPPTAYVSGTTKQTYTTIKYNIGSHYNGTDRFTAPVAGRYVFTVQKAINTLGPDKTIRHPGLELRVNGTTYIDQNVGQSAGADIGPSEYTHFTSTLTTVVNLAASDYVEVYFVYSGSPATQYEYGTEFFMGYLLG